MAVRGHAFSTGEPEVRVESCLLGTLALGYTTASVWVRRNPERVHGEKWHVSYVTMQMCARVCKPICDSSIFVDTCAHT